MVHPGDHQRLQGFAEELFRRHAVPLEEAAAYPALPPPDYRDIWEAVFSLPQKYRDVVYLHCFEEYTAPQISRILGENVNTVYTLLTRSKRMLREKLGDGYNYE